jgi:predicted peroxiredoxin
LIFATKAREKGHDSTIFLAGDGVLLMKSTIAADVKAVGQPGAAEVLRRVVELGIPIFV